MQNSKSVLKIFYIVSLVILGVLVGFALVRPAASSEQYSEVSKGHLLKTDSGYIVAFDIMNHEGKDTNYTVEVTLDSYQYSEDILIPDGRMFTYVHHIYPDKLTEGNVNLAIYKVGLASPFEQVNYYLKKQDTDGTE